MSGLLETPPPWAEGAPAHWRIDRLKATVTTCQNGLWGDEPDGLHDITCVRVADFDRTRRRVRLENHTLRAVPTSKRTGRVLRCGDLLIEKSGGGELQPVGTVVLYAHDKEAICSNFVARMPVAGGFHPEFITYLHQALYGLRVPERSIKQTTGIQNLDSAEYLNEKVALPPFAEQRAISDFLDGRTASIDALIAKKERLLTLLAERREAIVSLAVVRGVRELAVLKESGVVWLGCIPSHWGVAKVKHQMARIVDCLHSTPEYSPEGEYPAVRTADVERGRLNLADALRVSHAQYRARIQRLEPKRDDVLYSREGERFGMAALVPPGVKLCMAQRMMLFRTHPHASARYYMWALNSEAVYQQVKQDTVGATSPRINIPTVTNAWVPVPPLDEQEEIADHIERAGEHIDRCCGTVRNQVERLLEYRQALITAAVTGQLDVAAQPQEAA